MQFIIKEILLCLFLLFSFSIINAQESKRLPTDEDSYGLWKTNLVLLNVSVHSDKKGYLKDLTYKDFEVYDEKEFQEIDFFKFDELKNHYVIGFYQGDFIRDKKWHTVKVKISKEKKGYGKVSVSAPKGYYPIQN